MSYYDFKPLSFRAFCQNFSCGFQLVFFLPNSCNVVLITFPSAACVHSLGHCHVFFAQHLVIQHFGLCRIGTRSTRIWVPHRSKPFIFRYVVHARSLLGTAQRSRQFISIHQMISAFVLSLSFNHLSVHLMVLAFDQLGVCLRSWTPIQMSVSFVFVTNVALTGCTQ